MLTSLASEAARSRYCGTKSKLYVLPGSHPCAAVEAALALKSIDYDRVDLLPMSQMLIGPLRYGGPTVPGMRLDGEKLVGSRTIMRRLDELEPEPPLLPPPGRPRGTRGCWRPSAGAMRCLQSVPRHDHRRGVPAQAAAMESYAGDAKLPLPRALMRPAMPLTARLMALRNKAERRDRDARTSRRSRASWTGSTRWIAEGVLGGEQPNAADLQIGSTIRLLLSIGDMRPLIENRPAAQLTKWFPPMVGEIEAGVLPAEWFPAPVGV